jgi:hypothetical protein
MLIGRANEIAEFIVWTGKSIIMVEFVTVFDSKSSSYERKTLYHCPLKARNDNKGCKE